MSMSIAGRMTNPFLNNSLIERVLLVDKQEDQKQPVVCGECGQTEDKCPGPFGACGNPAYEEGLHQRHIFDM